MYSVKLASSPRRFYGQADHPLAKKLARCLQNLEVAPRHHANIKPLKGPFAGLHRYRVGKWRVVYRIDDKARIVHVLDIAHRSDVYE